MAGGVGVLRRGWMESLGASGRVFANWPAAGDSLSR